MRVSTTGASITSGVAMLAALLTALLIGCGDDAGSTSAGDVTAAADESSKSLALTTDLPSGYEQTCQELASIAPTDTAACPRLIPKGALAVEAAGPYSRKGDHGGYTTSFSSASISQLGDRRIETNGGHWGYQVLWSPAAKLHMVRDGVETPTAASKPSDCNDLEVADQAMEVCRVVPYEAGGGFNGGHIVYIWEHDDLTYVISMHGYPNDSRVRAMMAALVSRVEQT